MYINSYSYMHTIGAGDIDNFVQYNYYTVMIITIS